MIVCSCNAICEDRIRAAARCGAPCPRSAYANLGFAPQCGTCLPYAAEIIEEERTQLLSVDAQAA
jgi:bacterioferritin-associated ferredoxin